uniref:Tyrosine-protein phosphatase non-receptor type 23 n=1 Tax=Anolis carolinensis TaxID=28377 RepID=A0A803U109_ANOCA
MPGLVSFFPSNQCPSCLWLPFRYNSAKKDNDFIYHEAVPALDTLQSVKGAPLVKALPVNPTDPTVTGPDIFAKLVPMAAHEASSLYSEEKAKLLREVMAKIEAKNEVLEQFMDSLQLDPETVDNLDMYNHIPPVLMEKCAALSVRPETVKNLVQSMQVLSGVFTDVEASLREIKDLLDEDEAQEQKQRETLGKTAAPQQQDSPPATAPSSSSSGLAEVAKEWAKYMEVHEKASFTNTELHKAMNLHISNLRLLSGPLEQVRAALPSPSLTEEDQQVMQNLKRILSKVQEMKDQRVSLEQQLREMIQKDDITTSLVTTDRSEMKKLFEEQLKKYDQIKVYLEQNLAAQENILKALTEANVKYATVRKALSEVEHKWNTTLQSLVASYEAYEDLMKKSQEGKDFYADLESKVAKLLEKGRVACKAAEAARQQALAKEAKLRPPPRPTTPKPPLQKKPTDPEGVEMMPALASLSLADLPEELRSLPPEVLASHLAQLPPDALAALGMDPAFACAGFGGAGPEAFGVTPLPPPRASQAQAPFSPGHFMAGGPMPGQYQPPRALTVAPGQRPFPRVPAPGPFPSHQMPPPMPRAGLPPLSSAPSAVPSAQVYPTRTIVQGPPLAPVQPPYQGAPLPPQHTSPQHIPMSVSAPGGSYGMGRPAHGNVVVAPAQPMPLAVRPTTVLPHQNFGAHHFPSQAQVVRPATTTVDSIPGPHLQLHRPPEKSPARPLSGQHPLFSLLLQEVLWGHKGPAPPTRPLPGPLPSPRPLSRPPSPGRCPPQHYQLPDKMPPPMALPPHSGTMAFPTQPLPLRPTMQPMPPAAQGAYGPGPAIAAPLPPGPQQQPPPPPPSPGLTQMPGGVVVPGPALPSPAPSPQPQPPMPPSSLQGPSETPFHRQGSSSSTTDDLLSSSPESQHGGPKAAVGQPLLQPTKADAKDGLRPKAVQLIENDPYEKPERLRRLLSELERFQEAVAALGRPGPGGTELDGLWKELQEAQEKDARQRSIAIARCYAMKNRHQDIMPYDKNRVVLQSGKDDYINASRIEDLSSYCPTIIATQAPLVGTASDFWLMIYEQKVSVVVMLVSEQEIEKQKVLRYFPTERGQPMVQGPITLVLTSQKATPTHTERMISLQFRDQSLKRTIIHLQFFSWPELGLPDSKGVLLRFIQEVHSHYLHQRPLHMPIVVHCSSGVGRSGAFCLLYAAMQEVEAGNSIPDLARMVKRIRQQRKHMLQEKLHLKFCFEAVLKHAKQVLQRHGVIAASAGKPPSSTPYVHQDPQDLVLGGDMPISSIQATIAKLSIRPPSGGAEAPAANGQPPTEPSMTNAGALPAASHPTAPDPAVSVAPEQPPPPPLSPPTVRPEAPAENSNHVEEETEEGPTNVDAASAVAASAAAPSSSSLELLASLTPEAFTLDSALKGRQRVSKQSFLQPQNGEGLRGARPSDDPLSLLDPLWTLNKT